MHSFGGKMMKKHRFGLLKRIVCARVNNTGKQSMELKSVQDNLFANLIKFYGSFDHIGL